MKRKQIIEHKEQLEAFLYRLRLVIWISIVLSIGLFALATWFLLKKMLLSSVLVSTLGFIIFRVVRKYSVIITKRWVRSRGEQEEMLNFLDEEMKGTTSREFFHLLERALAVVDESR